MANKKKRAPKANPIPKAAPKAPPAPKLAPGERAVTGAGRVLFAQTMQRHQQEVASLLQMLSKDAGCKPGAMIELDAARMVFVPVKPDAKPTAKPKG